MRNNRWILATAWLLLWLSSLGVVAASKTDFQSGAPYTIDVWEAAPGKLPQNEIITMIQSRDGYLWLGTLSGLVRFDGIRFTVFDESNTPGLDSSRIISLFEDSQTNLWVGTETAGVVLVKEGRVSSLDIGRGSREGRLMSACEDSSGAVWLYTADGQLCRYRNGRRDIWRLGAKQSSKCRRVIAGESGRVLVATDWSLFVIGPTAGLEPTTLPVEEETQVDDIDFILASERGGYWRLAEGRVQKWSTTGLERDWGPYTNLWNRSRTPVKAACEDRQGNLLVGTGGAGVFWFDPDGKATCLSTKEGLSHNIILSLHADREDSLWVGTDGGGLNRVKRQVFDVLQESRGLVAQSVCEDAEGGLWIGYNGGGVDLWSKGVLQRFDPSQFWMASVRAVFADGQRVWVGTSGAGLIQLQLGQIQRVPGVRTLHPVVLAIHQDRINRLWVGTQGGLARLDGHAWKTYTTLAGLSSDEVRAIADDAEGNLWVGTMGGGLNLLRDDKFTAFRKKDGLPSDNISSLLADDDGVLWVGTDGGGLARLHKGKWTRYTTREGLISNSVGYLVEDGQGYLWIGSNAGLMRVKKKALNDLAQGLATFIPVRAYGEPDGLPSSECTSGSQPGACRTRDGKLWFPTIKGLVSVKPDQLKSNTNPPPVRIESVLIDDQPHHTNALRTGFSQAVTIPAGTERLEIRYTSLNLAAPERARFKYRLYRLKRHETAWTEAGNIRIALYPRLSPGHYRFQVMACNEDGVWNEKDSSLALMVETPFWRTWWFLTSATVLFLGTIIAVVRYFSTQKLQRQLEHLRQQEALEKERARIARDIHDQVGASLTQVSLLGELVESDKNSPEEVEAHGRQISQTALETTRALDEIVWTVNPSNDTLDGLITYVCKHAQEYLAVAGLRYRLDVPTQLPSAVISPEVRHNVFLASKEAVTNVVRHAKASAVWVRLRLEPDRFTLEIEDNGRGLADMDEKAGRNGLRNMRKRMEDIGGDFSIRPAAEGGTLIRLTAPLGNH